MQQILALVFHFRPTKISVFISEMLLNVFTASLSQTNLNLLEDITFQTTETEQILDHIAGTQD